jgi:hypothetical protein
VIYSFANLFCLHSSVFSFNNQQLTTTTTTEWPDDEARNTLDLALCHELRIVEHPSMHVRPLDATLTPMLNDGSSSSLSTGKMKGNATSSKKRSSSSMAMDLDHFESGKKSGKKTREYNKNPDCNRWSSAN